jgi:hypothetical protein
MYTRTAGSPRKVLAEKRAILLAEAERAHGKLNARQLEALERLAHDWTVQTFEKRCGLPLSAPRSPDTAGPPPATTATLAQPLVRTRSREHRARPSTRSSARSGDSGDDSGEPEPASRVCACGCGRTLDHLRVDAKTFSATCRQRLKRGRDRTDGLTEPELRPLGKYMVQPWELGELRSRPGCRCNGHHIAARDEHGVRCVKCGHWRDIPAVTA